MASSVQDAAMQAAETLQTAHIQHSPTVEHDMNPSTAASEKEPVLLDRSPSIDSVPDVESDEVPLSIVRPQPRRPQMPPLPDLRFEQSYLASIKDASDWKGVTFITLRDQVFMPLVQGMAWTLVVAGWRFWNRSSQFSGQNVGAKIRRWWWGVNNWKIPAHGSILRDQNVAEDAREFYESKIGNAVQD